ncbi:SOS response-associated peptidase [Aminobacter ciceronei]|uniref:Abasic site processing protein n=1 Tax=Aminobacter ciceronei TaxID=150723 RepID=A0ABR6C396_9HYPH|nr:SOS response-associated peptidase [Aminobacter ciceronei]MBA8905479.1 putative SOS response-associated peptidase YedK [Aminobacter ciceronei]MBA9019221.1 putative SOS response-associated peptidase YedK [Aminobacter ciceronei]
MCGRVFVRSTLAEMVRGFSFADPGDVGALDNSFPRYNGAPSLVYPVIVQDEAQKGSAMFVQAKWGLVPSWQKEAGTGRPPPVNARSETIATNGLFKRAYASRRCLVPIDGYFEWHDIHGTGKDKQPYAIAMKDGSPFALAGIVDLWRNPETGELLRSFAIVTCSPNELMATIHDRMPVILAPVDYQRWIGPDADPAELMKPFPAGLMTMWKIGRKVGSPKNDTPDILDPAEP